VFIAWGEVITGNSEVILTRSTDGGTSFLPPTNISNTPTSSGFPSIAVDSQGGVLVTWSDNLFDANAGEILLRRSTDSGGHFSPLLNISKDFQDSGKPNLAISGLNVFFVWHSFGQLNQIDTMEIQFSRSADGRATFSLPVNISNPPKASEEPKVAATGASAYVVWNDFGDILFSSSLPVPDPAPKITDVSPSFGPVGSTLTLTGLNFGQTRGRADNVFIKDTQAEVLSWSDTKIQVKFPSLSPGTYPVVVFKGAVYSNSGLCQIIAPLSISGAVRANGNLIPGITVKLAGTASTIVTTNAFGAYTFSNLAPGT
jgi:hypothetical protein